MIFTISALKFFGRLKNKLNLKIDCATNAANLKPRVYKLFGEVLSLFVPRQPWVPGIMHLGILDAVKH